MDKTTLAKANKISSEISQIDTTVRGIDNVLENYDQYRSSISLQSEHGVSFSLGAKKHNFKEEVRAILEKVKAEALAEKADWEKQLRSL